MSGTISFKIKKGEPNGKNPMFKKMGWYPNWFLSIVDEDGKEAKLTPRFDEISGLVETIAIYERLQLYDFFKIKESKNGTFRKLILEAIERADDKDIAVARNEFVEKFDVYKETLEKKEEIQKEDENKNQRY